MGCASEESSELRPHKLHGRSAFESVCVCVCVCVCEVGSASAKVGRVAGQACGAWNVRVEFGFCSATVREPQQVLGLGDMLGVLEKPLCV
jgi:hypothetical protein